jgi:hypothetical protein
MQGGKHIFFPTFFLILPDVILLILINKKNRKMSSGNIYSTARIALPVTKEMTVVGTPQTALAPQANNC